MSRQGTIKRYSLILQKVGSNQFPSLREIQDYLEEEGFTISTRTTQRDLEAIRNEFGVEITYNNHKNGYFIDEKNSVNIPSFLRFLEIVNTAELLIQCVQDGKENLKYLSLESSENFQGIHHLKALLEATTRKIELAIKHLNYSTGKIKEYQVQPYLLKEYQNRWYLIAFVRGLKEFRTFGIDRILEVTLKNETFIPDPKSKIAEKFENIIGVSYNNNKLQKVILSFTIEQANYIKSLPLHKSQKIVVENADEVRCEYILSPNFEFIQRILMLGPQVKVIEPQFIIDEVKQYLKEALDNYK
jgi:predicted DNA-binding transcriptional regulator YafY